MGSESCTPCPSGTYNPKKGSKSYKQCYPCPLGTLNLKYGSAKCLDCQSNFDCPVGSKKTNRIALFKEYVSVQPKLYTPPNQNITFYFIASVFCLFLLTVVVFFSVQKLRMNLKAIDIYSNMHNNQLLEPMIMIKNNIGGFYNGRNNIYWYFTFSLLLR